MCHSLSAESQLNVDSSLSKVYASSLGKKLLLRHFTYPDVNLMALCYVLLNVEPGSEEKVLNEVRLVPNVKKCHRVYGVYDMIAEVEADSMDRLKEIVTWKIRRLDGVRSTLTALVIE